jgi:hypothetical protein
MVVIRATATFPSKVDCPLDSFVHCCFFALNYTASSLHYFPVDDDCVDADRASGWWRIYGGLHTDEEEFTIQRTLVLCDAQKQQTSCFGPHIPTRNKYAIKYKQLEEKHIPPELTCLRQMRRCMVYNHACMHIHSYI